VRLVKAMPSARGEGAAVLEIADRERNRQVRRMCEAVGHPARA
jgi:16S rRNA U516 pseudouridylate synthase RsuA-like enzyme